MRPLLLLALAAGATCFAPAPLLLQRQRRTPPARTAGPRPRAPAPALPLTVRRLSEMETLAAPFFAGSLFPYLGFLYLLNKPETAAPAGVKNGFAFLLTFVLLTIPAGIFANSWYGVPLADCDWLHGGAESLLTVTNLITVVGFRAAVSGAGLGAETEGRDLLVKSAAAAAVGAALVAGAPAGLIEGFTAHTPFLAGVGDVPAAAAAAAAAGWHVEPANALSVPCWVIHWTSLVEFLVAMGFAWRYADVSGNPRWRGLTWGMIPSHSSGITACAYHLFYNNPDVSFLIVLQAALTFLGNCTLLVATWRIAQYGGWQWRDELPAFLGQAGGGGGDAVAATPAARRGGAPTAAAPAPAPAPQGGLVGFEDLGDALQTDTDWSFVVKLFAGCTLLTYVTKYGELGLDFPFEANPAVALALVGVPTALNVLKWKKRSETDAEFEGYL